MRNPYITVPALGCGSIETLSEHRTWKGALDAASRNDRVTAVGPNGERATLPPLGHSKLDLGAGRFGQGLSGKERVAWVSAILAGVA